jgi:hypothetical protein
MGTEGARHVFADYPILSELALDQRPVLHPLFQALPEGISEFTFANFYLFRKTHHYRLARLPGGLFVFTGRDAPGPPSGEPASGESSGGNSGGGGPPSAESSGGDSGGGEEFFMLPFGLPARDPLDDLFERFRCMKAVSEPQSIELARMGCRVEENRDNSDYIYSRAELSTLPGPKFHKKKNQINKFLRHHLAEGRPLLEEHLPQALEVLEAWRALREDPGDYEAAREALARAEELQLCGGIYYVGGQPVAYTLGEENARGTSFVIHFEKAVHADQYAGIYQFMNQVFASILPEKYDTLNREQDLGDAGLRQAKESYNPIGFLRKFRAWKDEDRRMKAEG